MKLKNSWNTEVIDTLVVSQVRRPSLVPLDLKPRSLCHGPIGLISCTHLCLLGWLRQTGRMCAPGQNKIKDDSVSFVVSSKLSLVTFSLSLSICTHAHIYMYIQYTYMYMHTSKYMHYILYIPIVYLCFIIPKYLHIHYLFYVFADSWFAR